MRILLTRTALHFSPVVSVSLEANTVGRTRLDSIGTGNRFFASSIEGGSHSANLGNDNTAQGIDSTPIGNDSTEGGSDSAGVNLDTIAGYKFQNLSGTLQEHLKNSSKEFLRCVSSTPNKDSLVDETAIAHEEGASPQIVEGVEEKEEESPTATDCTSPTLVDEQEGQSALLLTENQDLGVEPTIPHEDTCSAPQVEVVTNLSQCGHVRHPHEQLAVDKWSEEAMDRRRELRPERENKLRCAGILGDNPGFDFLLECWDDVALWLKIKQLIAKYPEWGVAYVEGKLVFLANDKDFHGNFI